MLKKIKFKITGTHCQSCKTLIETEIDVLPGVKSINVNYATGATDMELDEAKISKDKIFKAIKKLGYTVDIEHKAQNSKSKMTMQSSKQKFYIGLVLPIIVAIFIGGYFLVDKLGGFELLAQLNETKVGYSIIFIIGLLAGFHCVGMCGGLVVAYSASELKKKEKQGTLLWPHLQYNTGRIISYTVIGGILGGLGSFFGINPMFTGVILILASIFMILMGLSFLTNLEILKKIKINTPSFIAKYLYNQKHSRKSKGPFIIGLLNGFMPCGPLQAVQLYALASGDIIQGALSMGVYSIGTAILMFGFGLSLSAISGQHIKKMLKVSGVLVIFLGLIMANRGLANFGIGISFKDSASTNNTIIASDNQEYQEVKMDLTYLGYKPNVLYIKKGIPVRWIINVKEMTGCTDAIMIESLGIEKNLEYGRNVIEFTPPLNAQEIKFSCWMRMVWGKFVVTDDNTQVIQTDLLQEAENLPTSGTCGGSCGSPTCGAVSGGSCGCGR
ncbi:sulfite exporter TauE/SafE family protein [Patescibacteria group bacterium]